MVRRDYQTLITPINNLVDQSDLAFDIIFSGRCIPVDSGSNFRGCRVSAPVFRFPQSHSRGPGNERDLERSRSITTLNQDESDANQKHVERLALPSAIEKFASISHANRTRVYAMSSHAARRKLDVVHMNYRPGTGPVLCSPTFGSSPTFRRLRTIAVHLNRSQLGHLTHARRRLEV